MADYRAYAVACIEALQGWYNPKNGLWNSTGWWNAANALEALLDYALLTGTNFSASVMTNTYKRNRKNNFFNDYYDDEGWWALAWIKAYDLTQDKRYVASARTLFEDMCKGWDDVCGGGLWWKKDRTYKAAIQNELFLTVAARLFQRVADATYLEWMYREWDWFQKSGMLNAQSLVNNGLNDACQNDGQTTWTYNQGVILGALVEMYKIQQSSGETDGAHFLQQAQRIADAAITTLVNANGILTEPCEANNGCGADGTQFKGIFMRNLGYLCRTLKAENKDASAYKRYQQFIVKNVESIWANNRTRQNRFGLKWAGPVDATDASRQSSALDAFNAAIPFSSLA
jgi:predicted alpha-1,6-mannanase (GH76 family)